MPAPLSAASIFAPTAIDFERMFVLGMDDVIVSGLNDMRAQFFTAMCLYVLCYAFLTMYRKVDAYDFVWAGGRALLISALLNSTNYNFYVRQFFFTDLPNRWAFAMGGPRAAINSAEQFDRMWSAALNAVSIVLQNAAHWTQFMDRGMAWVHAGLMLIALILMFVVWLASRAFMAIVICLGPFILLTFLFSGTRHIGMSWIGKLVGLTALQLASSILMRILLVVVHGRMLALQSQMGTGVDTQLATLAGIDGVFWMGALLMLSLPAAISIGSGGVAGAAAASARVNDMMGKLGSAPLRLLRS